MLYELGLQDDGWLVADTIGRRVAEFGGVPLQGLTKDEAHTMLRMLLDHERGLRSLPELIDTVPTSPPTMRMA